MSENDSVRGWRKNFPYIIRSADAENVFAVQTSENVFASPEGAWQSGQTLKDQITQLKQNEKIKAQIEKLEKL